MCTYATPDVNTHHWQKCTQIAQTHEAHGITHKTSHGAIISQSIENVDTNKTYVHADYSAAHSKTRKHQKDHETALVEKEKTIWKKT